MTDFDFDDYDYDDIADRADDLRTRNKVEPEEVSGNGNIAWIDTETTGLDVNTDYLLEVACIITDGELNQLDDGVFHSVVYWPKHGMEMVRDNSATVVQEMHAKTGLWDKVTDAKIARPLRVIDYELLEFLKKHGASGVMPIAGNSVAFDARFMKRWLPLSFEHLHYHMIDVSSVAELAKRWYPEFPKLQKHNDHTALVDIAESIRELKHYREVFFK